MHRHYGDSLTPIFDVNPRAKVIKCAFAGETSRQSGAGRRGQRTGCSVGLLINNMKESEKSFEFTIDNLESLSIRNNWCSWCVNVFTSDPTGEWNSCGTGLLSFSGKKRNESTKSKLQSIKELKSEAESSFLL